MAGNTNGTYDGVVLRAINRPVSTIPPSYVFENGQIVYGTDNSVPAITISHKVGNGVTAYSLLAEISNAGDVTKDYVDAQDALKEPLISTGTILQYWRGDKTWAAFPAGSNGVILTDNSYQLGGRLSSPVIIDTGVANAFSITDITNSSVDFGLEPDPDAPVAFLSIETADTIISSGIQFGVDQSQFSWSNTIGNLGLNLNPAKSYFIDTVSNFGIKYAADYSAAGILDRLWVSSYGAVLDAITNNNTSLQSQFIQNQKTSSQISDYWISGTARIDTNLIISAQTTAASNNLIGAQFKPTSTNSGIFASSSFQTISPAGANSTASYYGSYSEAGSIGTSSGTYGIYSAYSGNIISRGAGILTSASSFTANVPFFTNTGVITQQNGVSILPQWTVGITNSYGIFQQGNQDDNYFNGNIGIQTINPISNLHVTQSNIGVGVVAVVSGSTTVTGTNTQFTNTFRIGQTITVNGETRTISAIASDTSMTTDVWTGTSYLPSPQNVIVLSTSGGSLAAATYYYVVVARNGAGTSLGSSEVFVVTSGSGTNIITWSSVVGASSYDIYRGTSSSGENVYFNTTNYSEYIDEGTVSGTAGTPPVVNTAVGLTNYTLTGRTILQAFGNGNIKIPNLVSGTPLYNVLIDATGNLVTGAVPVGVIGSYLPLSGGAMTGAITSNSSTAISTSNGLSGTSLRSASIGYDIGGSTPSADFYSGTSFGSYRFDRILFSDGTNTSTILAPTNPFGADYSYTLPTKTGTFAMLSDIGNYLTLGIPNQTVTQVPYFNNGFTVSNGLNIDWNDSNLLNIGQLKSNSFVASYAYSSTESAGLNFGSFANSYPSDYLAPMGRLNFQDLINDGTSYNGVFAYENTSSKSNLAISGAQDIVFVNGKATTTPSEKLRLKYNGLLEGAADYSSLYDNNSYVQKVFIDKKYATNNIDVFVIAGQSNAYGTGDLTLQPAIPAGIAYMWNGTTFTNITTQSINVGGTLGSAWASFAIAYYAKTGRRVLFIPTAVISSAQVAAADIGAGNWDTSGALYAACVSTTLSGITAATTNNFVPILKGILWWQGETDAAAVRTATITQGQYQTALTTMIANFRTSFSNLSLPFYMVRIGRNSLGVNDSGFIAVQNTQNSVAAADSYTFVATNDVVDYYSNGLTNPTSLIHMSQAGYNRAGQTVGEFVGGNYKHWSDGYLVEQFGKYGIGVTEPSYSFQLGVDPLLSTSSSIMSAQYIDTSTASGGVYGTQFQTVANPASTSLASFYASIFQTISLTGNSQNITNLNGLAGNIVHNGTGTVDQSTAFVALTPSVPYGGTISKAVGIQINKQNGTGIGIGYGVYQSDGSDLNVFAGKTIFGNGTSSLSILNVNQNRSLAAWGQVGAYFNTQGNITDTTSTGTVTDAHFNVLNIPVLGTTNAGVTFTNAATLAIIGAPSGTGTNTPTITNAYSFWVKAGTTKLDGTVNLGALTASQALFLDSSKNIVSNTITGTGSVVMSTSPTMVTPTLGAATATSLAISGVAGAGFISLPTQSTLPSNPALGTQLIFGDASGRFTIMGSNGFAATFTKTLLSTSQVFSLPNATTVFLGNDNVDTISNKRYTYRVQSISSNASTYSINTDSYDQIHITAQTATITNITTTGTPVDGDKLLISITATATTGFTFDSAKFEASGGVALSTTTNGTVKLLMGFGWNTETSKWRQIAVA